jgi:GNAT superfamily N-acetyltransferase
MKWYARTDANQAEIVEALRRAGASVLPLHRLGQGAPDIACGWRGKVYFMEIKSDGGKLTPAEQEFMDKWRGHYAIVRTVEEALAVIGIEPEYHGEGLA